MVSDHALAKIVRDLIGLRSQGVYWDFKLKHHATTGGLVHNVLCLANAGHEGPRFVVFGVEDSGVSVRTIKDDDRRRTQANIAGLFHDNAGKFFQSRFPTFHLPKIATDTNLVDVLVVEDEAKQPYFLVERFGSVRAPHIHARVCDTNMPVDPVAPPCAIERMWRKRFGLDSAALERT